MVGLAADASGFGSSFLGTGFTSSVFSGRESSSGSASFGLA